jgi:hypothetical protein
MQEKINLEEYVEDNNQNTTVENQDQFESEFNQFEEWAEAVEQGKLTDDQIQELKNALAELTSSGQQLELGPEGQTAWQFFNGLGIEDADLEDKLKSMADIDNTTDPIEVFKAWANESYPELLVALGLSNSEEPAPETPPAEQPAPEAPPAEQPVAEGSGSIMKDIAETVKRFYNASNEDVGPFRSEEAICLEVKKTISEKYGDRAGMKAEAIAKQFMEKLTKQWEMKHHKNKEELAPVDNDGLARLKELLGNVKAKVEGMTSTTEEHNDTFDPKSHAYKTTMKHADNPTVQQRMAAHDIQPGVKGYRDRIDMLRDLERTGKLKPETDEGMMDKVKSFGKKVLDKVAPDDATLLKKLEKDSGGRIPPQFEPKPEPKNEMAEILKLSGLTK